MRWCALVAVLGAAALAHAQPDTTKHDDKSDATEAPRAVTSGEAAAGGEASKQAAAARFLEGERQFRDGHFIEAAEEFNAAFGLDADPVYLYNSAQAYRRGGACARAADYYRRFLIAVPNPPNLDKVQHYLHDLDACVKAEAPTTPDTPTTVVPTAPTPPPPPPPPEPVVKPAPAPVAHVDPRSHTLRLAGIATAVGGVALLGVGVWFTHDVGTLEGYSGALCSPTTLCQWDAPKQQRAHDLSQRGDRATALAITAYGVGGAAVLTGVTLYVLGVRGPGDTIPTLTPVAQGGVASITGRF